MYQYSPRHLLVFLVFLCLTACGGGSNSSSPGNPGTNSQLANQAPLTFEFTLITVGLWSNFPTNLLSGGSGTGGITYSSSDPRVATIDASTGALTLVAPGSTTITATKAADSNYLSASASYDLVVEKAEQDPLIFAQDVMEIFLHGVVPVNPLTGGEGEGDIIYNSSNSEVASVDSETGVVTLLSEGNAIVTATKAGDEIYLSNQASYEIIVLDVVSGLDIKIGPSDTRITWKYQHDLIETFRTSKFNCNVDNYPSCSNSRLRRFNQPPTPFYTDTFPKFDNLAYLQLQSPDYRSSQIRMVPAPLTVPKRWSPKLVSFKDRLWIIGGGEEERAVASEDDSKSYYYNDIWSSKDGVTWSRETEEADFPPRHKNKIIEFKGELYTFPTETISHSRNKVWKSSNGVNWTELTESNSPVQGLSTDVTVFDGKLWAVNVVYGETKYNQVWSSEDGINWSLEVPIAPFEQRSHFTLYADDQHLFLMGGYEDFKLNKPVYDVWVSSNGVQWNRAAEDGGYDIFYEGSVVQLAGKFYAAGGWGQQSFKPTVFISDNGINWSKLPASDIIGGSAAFTPVIFKDLIWMSVTVGPNMFMWSTSNGINWRVPVDTSDIQWQALD